MAVLHYRTKLTHEFEKLPVMMLHYHMLFPATLVVVFFALFIGSIVALSSSVSPWSYTEGRCNITESNFQVQPKGGKSGLVFFNSLTKLLPGCISVYTLTETVLIEETQTVGSYIIKDDSYFVSLGSGKGRTIGQVYDCYYKGDSVLFEREPYLPFIIVGLVSVILFIFFSREWLFTWRNIAQIIVFREKTTSEDLALEELVQ